MRRDGSEEQAYAHLLDAMKDGDYRAHYAIGTWYLHGRHVAKNLVKAARLLKNAADNDIAEAAFDLAVCYENGQGVKKNKTKAVAMYLRAMRLGDNAAANELYRVFYWGLGVSRCRSIALEFSKFK